MFLKDNFFPLEIISCITLNDNKYYLKLLNYCEENKDMGYDITIYMLNIQLIRH